MTIWEVIQLISTRLLEDRHLGPLGSYILAHDWPSKSREYGMIGPQKVENMGSRLKWENFKK